MYGVSPLLPLNLLLVYLAASVIALSLCMLTFIAVYKTKRVPYPTKLLSLGLILYDCLFLVIAIGAKFVTFEESVTLRLIYRGFQLAARIIVTFMAVERLFVLNWPYIYIRLGNKRRTRKVCICIIVVSLLQYLLIRLLLCNARGKATSCSSTLGNYYAIILTCCLVVSIAAYVKIFALVYKSSTKMTNLAEYKGTRASFLFLLNSAVTFSGYIAIAIYLAVGVSTEDSENQILISNLTDFVYVITCIFDSLVYAIWFKETQMEILRLFSHICPCVKPTVEKMRIQVFNIDLIAFQNIKSDNCELGIPGQWTTAKEGCATYTGERWNRTTHNFSNNYIWHEISSVLLFCRLVL